MQVLSKRKSRVSANVTCPVRSEALWKIILNIKSFVAGPDEITTVDPGTGRLVVNRCLEAWMRPSAGMERGGGASVPYGGPIVEMDALIGVKCIRCSDLCQKQHPTKQSFYSHWVSHGADRSNAHQSENKPKTAKSENVISHWIFRCVYGSCLGLPFQYMFKC